MCLRLLDQYSTERIRSPVKGCRLLSLCELAPRTTVVPLHIAPGVAPNSLPSVLSSGWETHGHVVLWWRGVGVGGIRDDLGCGVAQ